MIPKRVIPIQGLRQEPLLRRSLRGGPALFAGWVRINSNRYSKSDRLIAFGCPFQHLQKEFPEPVTRLYLNSLPGRMGSLNGGSE